MNKKKIRIGVVGLGGIGGFVGGLLANHYHRGSSVEVIFICRGATLEKILQNGLDLETKGQILNVHPAIAAEKPEDIGLLDLLIIAVKTYSLRQVLQRYITCLGEHSIVISLQNSVNAKNEISQIITHSHILDGCIYVASNVAAPGVVKHLGGPGKIYFGTSINADAYKWLEKTFRVAGINASFTANIQEVLWQKFLFVSPVAAITSAYGKTFGELTKEPYTGQLRRMMQEIYELASAKGICLSESAKDDALKMMEKFPYETKSSMQLDYEHGRPTEIEALVEFVVKSSSRYNLPAQEYKKIYHNIQQQYGY
ncbi:2-dehydropantoate 2-reductase [Fulvivirga imtechensis AK7]|uniref:2-dehydropantoate 2-reductase n=1 Tax=Fulvivirga imtechensis AK7 TaxID=1237149 RepID=L8JNF0_9BACT|nr:2-dehydropantoate 2-reductase [Fulvivirga imtechensis]ELR68897.1 2-dehydropantoate 2-reductase [Fulvivirga imtechensis AK7]